jgi:hypothetical protein
LEFLVGVLGIERDTIFSIILEKSEDSFSLIYKVKQKEA